MYTRVLAMLPNWLGDVAMCTPALRAIHRRYPEAQIHAAGRPGACALVQGLPYLTGATVLPARGGVAATLRAAALLRRLRADCAVVFPHSFRAALQVRLAGVPERVGYDRDRRRALLTQAAPPHRVDGEITPVYMTDEYLGLVASLGCADDQEGLELHADPAETARVRACLDEAGEGDGPLVGFAPGAAFGPSKRWPAERFAAVADALRDRLGARCVLLTGPGEEDTRDAIQRCAKTPLVTCDDGRPSIAGLKAVISLLDGLICNDSGPRHVAVAFGVPTVCVMGPTAPVYSCGPYERGELVRIEVDCGPCQQPVCATDHRCMTGISVERVVSAATRALRL